MFPTKKSCLPKYVSKLTFAILQVNFDDLEFYESVFLDHGD